ATGLGIFAVLPFAPITIPLIVKLGRKLGIEVLPSAFTPNGKRRAARIRRLQRTADGKPPSLISSAQPPTERSNPDSTP
ncbi:MAG: hypothetical protein KKA56_00630, partial [Gammaproteobacteria bacterium]|nr:hypothetical protein [Gammaproteobacteria bacterium]